MSSALETGRSSERESLKTRGRGPGVFHIREFCAFLGAQCSAGSTQITPARLGARRAFEGIARGPERRLVRQRLPPHIVAAVRRSRCRRRRQPVLIERCQWNRRHRNIDRGNRLTPRTTAGWLVVMTVSPSSGIFGGDLLVFGDPHRREQIVAATGNRVLSRSRQADDERRETGSPHPSTTDA